MDRERITPILHDIERRFPVETWEVRGVHVWPVVRLVLGFYLAEMMEDPFAGRSEENRPNPESGTGWKLPKISDTGKNVLRLGGKGKAALGHGRRLVRELYGNGDFFRPCDTAVVTYSTRVIPWGTGGYHTTAEPLVEALRSLGDRPVIWEFGKSRMKRGEEPLSLAPFQEAVYPFLRLRYPEILPRPTWYAPFADAVKKRGETPPSWPLISQWVRHRLILADMFTILLSLARCRRLIVDSWYDGPSSAACIAARRLRIRSIDFQHGLQDGLHFAYSPWSKEPPKGYECRPDDYWLWGEEEHDLWLRSPIHRKPNHHAAVGGNLWLNKWRSDPDAVMREAIDRCRSIRSGKKSVLVTLQPDVDLLPILEEAIDKGPKGLLWLIRLHRRKMEAMPEVRERLKRENVRIEAATTLPLYAWLSVADAHLTAFSTCAKEALPFGVPSVLVSEAGRRAYPDYVEGGVMRWASDVKSLLEELDAMMRKDKDAIRRQSERAFAPPFAAREVLQWILK